MIGTPSLRSRLHEIIFGHRSPAGRAFDVTLIVAIVLSVVVVLLDSVTAIRAQYGTLLYRLEWVFTILFTVEYGLRLYCSIRPLRYAVSFFGLVDLLAIIPTYLSLLFPGSRFLVTIRVLRVLRVFRILELVHFVGEANVLKRALQASRYKIGVFLSVVMTIVIVVGSAMYMIEGPESGFTSIPVSMYWAIVTLTTVGYGDVAPQSPIGQALAALLMVTGFGIIAVPTGIVTLELGRATAAAGKRRCTACGLDRHELDAEFCRRCGARL